MFVALLQISQVLLVILEGHFQIVLQVLDLLLQSSFLGSKLVNGLIKGLVLTPSSPSILSFSLFISY